MIAHAWTVIAEKCIIDRDTNNVSLDVLEQVTIPDPLPAGVPGVILPFQVVIVSLWYRNDPAVPARGRCRIRYLDPQRQAIGDSRELEIDLSQFQRTRVRFNSAGLPVNAPGRYFFIIERERDGAWDEVARVPLTVVVAEGAPQAAPH